MRELLISSATAILALALAAPATAQVTEAKDAPQDQLNEIIVTAQKRAEPLQKTPVAVTALGGEALENRLVSSVADLQGSVPGLVIGGSANFGGINSIVIRGVSSPNLLIGVEEAVGIYLDGVFLPRSDAAFFNFADVERIEVLRGPQGTLYGRNSSAGTINILTRMPEDTVEGKFDANYGSHDKYEVKGYVGGPLTSALAASVSAVKSGHGGYYTNTNTGNKIGMQDDVTVRGKLLLHTDQFRATLAADYTLLKADDVFVNIKNRAGVVVGVPDYDEVATEIEDDIFARRKSYGVSLTSEYDVSDDLTLTSISSGRWYRAHNFTDTDGEGGTARFAHTLGSLGNTDFDQELRANLTTDRLALTGGLNYFQDHGTGSITNSNVLGISGINILNSRTKAYAAFAQAEFGVTEYLKLIVGGRYNIDKKYFSITQPRFSATSGAFFSEDRRTDKAFLPKVGVTYQVSPTVFTFATISRGYRAGAYNPGNLRGKSIAPGANPEKLWNYEVGIKSELLDRHLRFNATAFHTKVSNLQVRETVAIGDAQINNAGGARVYGAEFEATAVLGGGLSLDATLSLLDGKYQSLLERGFLGAPVTFDRSGNDMIRAPHRQFSINALYQTDLSDSLSLKANVRYFQQTKSFYTAANEFGVGNDGWHSLDARAGITYNKNIEFYVYGKNLTDDRYTSSVLTLGAFYSSAVNDPRTYGAGVKYSF